MARKSNARKPKPETRPEAKPEAEPTTEPGPELSMEPEAEPGMEPKADLRAAIPLNINKVIDAIRARRMKRNKTEEAAGWWPGRINNWETKAGELTAANAMQASVVIDLPLAYILDDSIPLQDPPPTWSAYESASFAEWARLNGLEPSEAIAGLRVVGVMKAYSLEANQVMQMLAHAFEERARLIAGEVSRPPRQSGGATGNGRDEPRRQTN
jgi:hypothetical protein